MNLDELKALNRSALITEITEKTKQCGLVWSSAAKGQYNTTSLPYNMYLSKMGNDTYNLDVLKNRTLYRSYNSTIQPEVQELYEVVDSIVSDSSVNRMKSLISTISQIHGCGPEEISISMSGGIRANGTALVQKFVSTNTLLLPTLFSYSAVTYPWTGTVDDINDAPNVTSHDGDATYARQEVAGPLPTQWAYATCKFDDSGLPTNDPRKFRIRVAARREAELGVNLIIELVIGVSVVFTGTFTPSSAYSIYNSGFVTIPNGIVGPGLQVKLSMFTDTGNYIPRAVRVSAVDLTLNSQTPT